MAGIPATVGTLAEQTFGAAARDLMLQVAASDGSEPVHTTSTGALTFDNLEWIVTTVLSVKPIPQRKDMN